MTSTALVAVETSVAIPLMAASHPSHTRLVRWATGFRLALSDHALIETHAVATRLPGDPDVAAPPPPLRQTETVSDQPIPTARPETIAVAAGRPPAEPDAPLNPPVVLASTYVAGGEVEYGRYGNPTWTALEETIGALEGGAALSFASGLAAADALLSLVPERGVVVVPRHSYLGTLALLSEAEQRGRLTVRTVDIAETDAVIAALDGAAMLWIETPTNPALEVAEVAALADAAHAHGALVIVDNTFATPILQRPLDDGADVVMHSATKYLSGHSDAVLGAIVTRDDALRVRIETFRRLHGAIPGPMEAYLVLRGIRTLALRVERAQQNARALVERATGHPALVELRYPGFGAIVAPVFADADSADAFVASVRLARHATSLGGVETTLERRRRWASEVPTIPEGLVRVSVGIEHVDDLWADLSRALDAAVAPAATA